MDVTIAKSREELSRLEVPAWAPVLVRPGQTLGMSPALWAALAHHGC